MKNKCNGNTNYVREVTGNKKSLQFTYPYMNK